jgi:hypothetical protein
MTTVLLAEILARIRPEIGGSSALLVNRAEVGIEAIGDCSYLSHEPTHEVELSPACSPMVIGIKKGSAIGI